MVYNSKNPRMEKSPLLGNGYHAPPHFNPLQYMAQHMAQLGYPPILPGAAGLPGGLPANLPAGLPGGPGSHHPTSPTEGSPLKHPPITPETLTRMHEERMERDRQLSAEHRRSLPPISTPTSVPTSSMLHHQLQHSQMPPNKAIHPLNTPYSHAAVPPTSVSPTPPISSSKSSILDGQPPHHQDIQQDAMRSQGSTSGSPVLNLSKGDDASVNNDDRDDDRNDIISHDSERTMQDEDDRQHNSVREDERLSEMDDEDVDKDESMDTADVWGRASRSPGQTHLGPSPISSIVPPHGALLGAAPLSSTEVLLRNILGLLRVAEENARHHERRTQHEKDELKLEVMREREMRESLKKELQEEHKSRVLFQKRCAKLKKLRRQLQERLDMEVAQRNKKDSEGVRSATPDTLTEVNGHSSPQSESIRKELDSMSSPKYEPESHHLNSLHSTSGLTSEASSVDKMMIPPGLVAATSVGSWR